MPEQRTTERFCGHRWWASRVEVETSPVLHVCNEPWANHQDHAVRVVPHGEPLGSHGSVPVHRCACGAALAGDGPGPDGPTRAWTASTLR